MKKNKKSKKKGASKEQGESETLLKQKDSDLQFANQTKKKVMDGLEAQKQKLFQKIQQKHAMFFLVCKQQVANSFKTLLKQIDDCRVITYQQFEKTLLPNMRTYLQLIDWTAKSVFCSEIQKQFWNDLHEKLSQQLIKTKIAFNNKNHKSSGKKNTEQAYQKTIKTLGDAGERFNKVLNDIYLFNEDLNSKYDAQKKNLSLECLLAANKKDMQTLIKELQKAVSNKTFKYLEDRKDNCINKILKLESQSLQKQWDSLLTRISQITKIIINSGKLDVPLAIFQKNFIDSLRPSPTFTHFYHERFKAFSSELQTASQILLKQEKKYDSSFVKILGKHEQLKNEIFLLYSAAARDLQDKQTFSIQISVIDKEISSKKELTEAQFLVFDSIRNQINQKLLALKPQQIKANHIELLYQQESIKKRPELQGLIQKAFQRLKIVDKQKHTKLPQFNPNIDIQFSEGIKSRLWRHAVDSSWDSDIQKIQKVSAESKNYPFAQAVLEIIQSKSEISLTSFVLPHKIELIAYLEAIIEISELININSEGCINGYLYRYAGKALFSDEQKLLNFEQGIIRSWPLEYFVVIIKNQDLLTAYPVNFKKTLELESAKLST